LIFLKKIIKSKKLPKPIGTYSPAVETDNFLFTSGQVAMDKKTLKILNGDMEEQTLLALHNIELLLKESGLSKESIIKLTVYVTDLKKFNLVNLAFISFFRDLDFPARTTIEVSGLPLGAMVEIDCIAITK